jgi:hypothetical protein
MDSSPEIEWLSPAKTSDFQARSVPCTPRPRIFIHLICRPIDHLVESIRTRSCGSHGEACFSKKLILMVAIVVSSFIPSLAALASPVPPILRVSILGDENYPYIDGHVLLSIGVSGATICTVLISSYHRTQSCGSDEEKVLVSVRATGPGGSTKKSETVLVDAATEPPRRSSLQPGGRPQLNSSWSGYVLRSQSRGSFRAISAQWNVPTIRCNPVQNSYMSIWVGVDGAAGTGSRGPFQVGTPIACVDGSPYVYLAWTSPSLGDIWANLAGIREGDAIVGEVSEINAKTWQWEVNDITSGVTFSRHEPYSGPQKSAEWVVEDPPYLGSKKITPIPQFSQIELGGLGLLMSRGNWSVPAISDSIDLSENQRTTLTVTSTIAGYKSGYPYFDVLYSG